MKKYRLPLTCALVVLLSLALPFAVFSLWDKALLSAPHSQTAAQGLSAEARANSTACTLYACSHVLNVPLGYNSGSEPPWAQTAIDDATLDRARSALRALHDVKYNQQDENDEEDNEEENNELSDDDYCCEEDGCHCHDHSHEDGCHCHDDECHCHDDSCHCRDDE